MKMIATSALIVLILAYAAMSVRAGPFDETFIAQSDAAMTKMMNGMNVRPSGDVDKDFVDMMVPHHQGAIDMVEKLFNSYGAAQDELIYKFASDVQADQGIEIARMQKMLGDQ